jgi:hypothetical protein
LLKSNTFKNKKFLNNPKGFSALLSWLQAADVIVSDVHACMEATGVYGESFGQSGHDLRTPMRMGRSDQEIAGAIGLIWNQREEQYSEIRTEDTARGKKIEMSYIGG